MNSRYFYVYQIAGWLIVFIAIVATIKFTRSLVDFELFMAGILIATTAVYSVFTRHIYKKKFASKGFVSQSVYFAIQSFIGACAGGVALVAFIILLTHFSGQAIQFNSQFLISLFTIFWGNALNMFIASFAWSAIYLSITKARQLYEVKRALSTSQLEVLVQQLNPHFLFNMLNNIRALILEDPNRAREALAQLSDMLRYSLQQHKETKVTVAEELEIIEEYVDLCKIQFESRLRFKTNIDCEAKLALIPSMLLQLCIENAIKHGISYIRDGGLIQLNIHVKANELFIIVNNPIADKRTSKTIDASNEFFDTDEAAKESKSDNKFVQGHDRVGIRNMRERLQLLYPYASETVSQGKSSKIMPTDLHLHMADGMAEISIRLPLEYEDDAAKTNTP